MEEDLDEQIEENEEDKTPEEEEEPEEEDVEEVDIEPVQNETTKLTAIEVTKTVIDEPANQAVYEELIDFYLGSKDTGRLFQTDYFDVRVTVVPTPEDKKDVIDREYIEFYNFYCTQGDQNIKVLMKINPVEGQRATIKQLPTYGKPQGKKFWTFNVRAKGCTEGEEIGILAITTDSKTLWGPAPRKATPEVETANNKTKIGAVIKELFDQQNNYYFE